MEDSIVKIDHLVFQYLQEDTDEPVSAVKDVSLAIERGSFTAVIGRNGSGKSTLAKNINALLLPTSGTVTVDGIDTRDEARVWELRQRVAMVFQNPDNQLVSTIVEDDVAFGPENLGVPPEEIRRRVDEALKAVGMYEFRKRAPHLLSGGQKQRVAIAGAIAMRPECIVFDEPTAMLDPSGRKEVMSIIKKLNGEGVTVILITHFMEEAAEADRVVVMDRGEVLMDGAPAEIFTQPERIRATHLDVPAAVEIAEGLRARGVSVPQEIVSEKELAEWVLS